MKKNTNPFLMSPFEHLLEGITTPPKPKPTKESQPSGSVGSLLPPEKFRPLFEAAAKKYDLPASEIMALAQQESGYDPDAIGTPTQFGRAKGMLQYLDSTASEQGINQFSPEQSIDAAARQYSKRIKQGYTPDEALMAHFGGDDRGSWGKKTQAYGRQVREKANQIEQMLGQAPMPDTVANQPGAVISEEGLGEALTEKAKQLQDDIKAATVKKEEPKEEPGMLDNLADMAKIANLGLNTAAQDVREVTGRIPLVGKDIVSGIDYLDQLLSGKPSEQMLRETEESTIKSMTPEMQAALQKKWWDDETNSFGPATKDWRSYAGGVIQSLPEQALTMVPALRMAKATYATKIAAGAAPEVAAKAAARTATIAGGITEGLLGGAHSARSVREEIKALPDDVLLKSEAVQGLMKDGKTLEEVRTQLAEDQSTQAFITSGAITGLFGGMGDRAMANILNDATGGAINRMFSGLVKGAIGEGLLEEAPQSAGQRVAENLAMQPVEKRELTKDVINQAVGGAILGGIQGGGMGAVGGLAGGREPAAAPPAPPTAEPTPATPPATPPVPPAAAPQPEPSGPLSRSVLKTEAELAAAQAAAPKPVTVTTPDGQTITGFLDEYQEDEQGNYTARVLGTDGQTYQFTSQDDVTIQPIGASEAAAKEQQKGTKEAQKPAIIDTETGEVLDTPEKQKEYLKDAGVSDDLLNSLSDKDISDLVEFEKALFVGAEEQSKGFETLSGDQQAAVSKIVSSFNEVLDERQIHNRINSLSRQGLKNVPTEKLIEIAKLANENNWDLKNEISDVVNETVRYRKDRNDYSNMDETELRQRLKYITQQAKQTGWEKGLLNERKKVEKAINAIMEAKGASEKAAPAPAGSMEDMLATFEQEVGAAPVAPATTPTAVPEKAPEAAPTVSNDKAKEPAKPTETPDHELNTEVIGDSGMTIVHGSGNPNLKADDIQIVRQNGQKQGKKGRMYGGLYGTSEVDADQAKGYAEMMDGTPTLHDVKIKPGTKILHKEGDITRLSANYINDLVNKGVGVVIGTDPRGRKEYVVVDKKAIDSISPRGHTDAKAPASAPEVAVPEAAPAEVADPTKNKDGSQKWFGSKPKATEFLAKKGVTDTHEVKKVGSRWEIHAKEEAKPVVEEIAPKKAAPTKKAVPAVRESTPAKPVAPGRDPQVDKLIKERLEFIKSYYKIPDDVDLRQSLERGLNSLNDARYRKSVNIQNALNELKQDAENIDKWIQEHPVEWQQLNENRPYPLSGGDAVKELNAVTGLTEKAAKEQPKGTIEAQKEQQKEKEPATVKAEEQFAGNKLFTADKVAAARARMKSKLGQLNVGLDPEMLVDGMTIAGAYIESGMKKFNDYAKAMVDDFGDNVKPFLLSFWEGARNYPGLDTEGMTSVEDSKKQHTALMAEEVKPDDTEPGKAGLEEGAAGVRTEPVRPDEGERGAEPVSGQPAGRAGAERGRGAPAVAKPEPTGRDTGEIAVAGQPVSRGGRDSAAKRDRADSRPENNAGNYRIAQDELTRKGSWKETAVRNVQIIELVNQLDKEGRYATNEEKALLVQYTGMGASEIANGIFPDKYGRYKTGWEEVGQRLKSALTQEQYEQASRTTQYAHYTSEPVIRSIYDGVSRLGFNGGLVMEPGMGTGHFVGLQPDSMSVDGQYTGIEYDYMTSRIGHYLYPQANVINGDYTKTPLPRDYFDMAIGNPPFSSTKVLNDPEYKKYGFMLHDYFFAKTIDRVKPGGLMVLVTSKGTMDKANSKLREYVAYRANLLGAVRLPQTAFKANAGTEVVTDVLFLQKHAPGIEQDNKMWMGLGEVKASQGTALINTYFVENPQMVLGTHALTGSMYRKDEYTVEPLEGVNIEEAFAKAIQNLPENVYRPERGSSAERAVVRDRDFNPKHRKEGGLYVSDDGRLMQVNDGTGVELLQRAGSSGKMLDLKPKEVAFLKAYTGLRDALKQAQYDQLNDGYWKESLKALSSAYDTFVKDHGNLLAYSTIERTDAAGNVTTSKRFKNDPLLRLDAEGALAYALEKLKEDGTIVKGDVLNDRVLKRDEEPQIVTTQDAMFVSLNQIGQLDINDVARLAGSDRETVIAELGTAIYEQPGKNWITADEYLSGNVVRKLKEAQAAAVSNPKYQRNVEALLAAQPRPLGTQEISVRLGANWIPTSDVEDFAKEVLGQKMVVKYSPTTGQWDVVQHGTVLNEYGFDRMTAGQILESALNNREIKITWKDGEGKTHVETVATEKANDIAKKMRVAFSSWVWKDTKRSNRLVNHYNDNFNNIVPRKFDGSHLTLPGVSTRFKLYPHQKRAIWRTIQEGDSYLAHAVGSGKTFTMIAAGMEMKRLGLIDKPMYVVPNHMLAQFSREFLELYPAANIMVADEHNFHTDNRRRFIAQAALNNPDAIVITHSGFGRIGMSEEYTAEFIKGEIAKWQDAIEEVESDDRITRKRIERKIEGMERKLEGKQGKEKKDVVLNFEELGVDYMFVDEAHEFRKLDFATNQSNVKGIDPNGSQRAQDLFMKVKYLREKQPGRAITMASGTPITNTMGELYTVQRFFQPEQMQEDGTESFDAWASMYGDITAGFEQNAAGGYEVVSRFAKFQNVPELMSRIRSFMDILTGSNLGELVQRPTVEGGGREIKVTPVPEGYREYQKELERRISAIRSRKGRVQKGDDIILNVIADGRFSAIDMRFVDSSLPSDPTSKINQLLDDLIAAYNETKDYEYTDNATGKKDVNRGSSLMMFTDIGLGEQSAANRGFDMKAWVTKRLTDAGIPREHIAFMRDFKEHTKKERLFADMRAGNKRILIGGKEMETGTNVQKRLSHLFQLDAPWFPASVEQREGRIIRQGNQNPSVVVRAYATKGSYDSTMWGMNARKAKFIEQAMNGDASVRSLEDVSEASAFETAAALASGDERYMKLAGLRADVERLNRLRNAHYDDQNKLRREKHLSEQVIERADEYAAEVKEAIGKRQRIKAGEFAAKLGRTTYDSRDEFSTALFDNFRDKAEAFTEGEKKVGEIGGFDITFTGTTLRGSEQYIASLDVGIPGDPAALIEYPISPNVAITGLATRAVNQVNGLDKDLADTIDSREQNQRRIEQIDSRLGAPFPEEAELLEKVAEAQELEDELTKEQLAENDLTANGEAAVATLEVDPNPAISTGVEPEKAPVTDLVKFSKSEIPGKGIPLAELKRVIDDLKASYNGNIPLDIMAVESMESLYGPGISEDLRRVKGFYLPTGRTTAPGVTGSATPDLHELRERQQGRLGVAALIAGNLRSSGDARETFRHEILGHYGLNTFTPEDKADLLEKIKDTRGVKSLQPYWEEIDRNYVNNTENEKAEEVFARIAEEPETHIDPTWREKVLNFLNKLLRKIGLSKRPLTLAELRETSRAIAEGIRSGERVQQTFPRDNQSQFSKQDKDKMVTAATDSIKDEQAKDRDQLGKIIADQSLSSRLFVHPRTISTIHPEFTPVYRTAISQMEARDANIAELGAHITKYDRLQQDGKAQINKVLELGRLLERNYTESELKAGIKTPGVRKVAGVDDEGKPVVNTVPVTPLLSKEGDTIKLSDEEAKAYTDLRIMFDTALDKFRDQVLDEYGFPELIGVENASKSMLEMITPETSPERAETLTNMARFVSEIEQAKRTGYVPFARYGDYVVSVKEKIADLTFVEDSKEYDIVKGVTDDLAPDVIALGGEYVKKEGGWRVPKSARQDIKRLAEKTVYSEKVETGLVGKWYERRGKTVEDVPEVKEAIDRVRKEWVADNPSRRLVAFKTETRKPETPVSLTDVDALASVANIDNATWDAIRDKLADAIKGQGFRRHFFHSENIPGYTGDFERAMSDYIIGMSGYLSRRSHIKQWDRAVSNIKNKGKLHEYANTYRTYVNDPQEEFAFLRQIGFLSYIAGVPATAFANLTQVPFLTVPTLGQIAPVPLVLKEVGRAYKDALAMFRPRQAGLEMFDPEKAPDDLRDIMKKAWAEGVFVPLESYDLMMTARQRNVGRRRATRWFNKGTQGLSYLFTFAERLNRLVTYMAAARLANKKAVKENAHRVLAKDALAKSSVLGKNWSPENLAEWTVDESQFRMGKANRPTVMRGIGAAIMQFKSFMLQAFEAWYRMAKLHDKRGAMMMASSMAMLVVMAGVWGLPGADDLRKLVEQIYKRMTNEDIDLKSELRGWIMRTSGSQVISQIVNKGITYPTGIDLTRVGMGRVAPDSSLGALGIPADLLAGRPYRAMEKGAAGDYAGAAAELTPNFMKNIFTSMGWAQGGVRDKYGKVILPPDKLSTPDLVMKSLGFNPAIVTDVRDYEYAQRRQETAQDQLKRKYTTQIARSVANMERAKTPEERAEYEEDLRETLDKVKTHNEEATDMSQVIKISPRTVRGRVAQELEGVQSTWGKERKQARGAAQEMRRQYGLEEESDNETEQ